MMSAGERSADLLEIAASVRLTESRPAVVLASEVGQGR